MNYQYVNYPLGRRERRRNSTPSGGSSIAPTCSAANRRITNTGGGNTSSKIMETDPLTGEPIEVLWVKGSGGDLRTSKRENFSSLYQQKLLDLHGLYAADARQGPQVPGRGRHGGDVRAHHLQPEPARRAPSTRRCTAFLPGKHVDHMHPNAIIAIAASRRCEELTQEIFGGEMAYVPWMRPGFELGLAMQEIDAQNPGDEGHHDGPARLHLLGRRRQGLLHANARFHRARLAFTSTRNTRRRAATPRRSAAANTRRWTKTNADGACSRKSCRGCAVRSASRNVSSARCRTTRTSCASSTATTRRASRNWARVAPTISCARRSSRFTWTGIRRPKTRAALKQKLADGFEQYRKDYAAYYDRCKHANSPAMRDPNPTVVLIPGLGMIAWGKDKSESA